ncbi:hypothetical protein D7W34_03430 [Escherichia coli]|nr:hypothetical protein CE141_20780 [Escherichia coli]EFO2217114.1 hypothetical protein [Escherichia coli O11]EFO3094601.1 hypothetical protein [Escherichia coli O153]EFY0633041.1 hypothetical protein [Shigella flexneri]ATB95541.1 hypothetical protein CNQ52_20695 [Escherichia coli]
MQMPKITCFAFCFCCFNVNFDHLVHFFLLILISCNLLAAQAFSRTCYMIFLSLNACKTCMSHKII